jgi:hypothetical protein
MEQWHICQNWHLVSNSMHVQCCRSELGPQYPIHAGRNLKTIIALTKNKENSLKIKSRASNLSHLLLTSHVHSPHVRLVTPSPYLDLATRGREGARSCFLHVLPAHGPLYGFNSSFLRNLVRKRGGPALHYKKRENDPVNKGNWTRRPYKHG